MSQSVFITGAASGIGLASAQAFSKAGYKVALADLNFEAAEQASKSISTQTLALQADVRSNDSIQLAFNSAIEAFGKIDVVFANAGVSNMKRSIDLLEEDWDFNMDVNAKGVFFTNQIAVRHFLDKKFPGIIVNTASLAAKVGAPLLAHYTASKFAVLGWTKALAAEHAKDGIRINAVCPGFVNTSMQDREVEWEGELLGMTGDEVRQSYIDQTPLGRLCTSEDVADVVVFLASDSSRFMTGQGINVTGGVFMS